MEFAIINEVIAHYGSYDAAKERDYIRSQQRKAEPDTTPCVLHRTTGNRGTVAAYLSSVGGFRTVTEVMAVTNLSYESARNAMAYLAQKGLVERQQSKILGPICVGRVQRYRWVTT
jgi:hypothetical protein